MNRFLFVLVSLAMAAIPTAVSADSVQDRLNRLPANMFTSEKSIDALELCIGIGMSEHLMPTVLRGEKRRLIYGSLIGTAAIGYLVAIEDTDIQRMIAFNAGKGYDGRTDRAIRACL